MKLKCVETYEELYHQEPFDVAFCPYRISPLGAHIDHQYGKINGLANGRMDLLTVDESVRLNANMMVQFDGILDDLLNNQ